MNGPLYETCASCGLVQALPPVSPDARAYCGRCDHALSDARMSAAAGGPGFADHTPTLAAALAAALLYPFAILLPIMEIERFYRRT